MKARDPGEGILYQTVWRWHFLAGVVTAPFAIFLAVTGATYLWKPQFEDWRYHRLLHVPASGVSAPSAPTGEVPGAAQGVSPDAQFAAARATHPDAGLVSFSPAAYPGRTSETILSLPTGEALSVFVDPGTGRVLGERRDSDRLMERLKELHGTLLSGKAGQFAVELAASWMFVLLLTGFYLWWPRPRFSVWGFLLPRLRSGRRLFWRDLHAVTAVWGSLAMAFLLATGTLWTQAGGGWYRQISAALGQGTPRASLAGVHQSAVVGWAPPLKAGLAAKVDGLASSQPPHGTTSRGDAPPVHNGTSSAAGAPMGAAGTAGDTPAARNGGGHVHGGHKSGVSGVAPGAIPLARVMEIARAENMPAEYAILFPNGPTGVFSVVSDRDHPFQRTYLHLDQYSGQILAEVRYRDFGLLGRFGMWAIIAHEGHLFGMVNQVFGTMAALGVILIAAAGLVLWRMRAPRPASTRPVPTHPFHGLPLPVKAGLGLLALALPLLAASLAAIALADQLILRRVLRPEAGRT